MTSLVSTMLYILFQIHLLHCSWRYLKTIIDIIQQSTYYNNEVSQQEGFQWKTNCPLANGCLDYKWTNLNRSGVPCRLLKWTSLNRAICGYIGTLPCGQTDSQTDTTNFPQTAYANGRNGIKIVVEWWDVLWTIHLESPWIGKRVFIMARCYFHRVLVFVSHFSIRLWQLSFIYKRKIHAFSFDDMQTYKRNYSGIRTLLKEERTTTGSTENFIITKWHLYWSFWTFSPTREYFVDFDSPTSNYFKLYNNKMTSLLKLLNIFSN